MDLAVLSDAPVDEAGDRLEFRRYVDPLMSVLTSPATETPFTIGVFGAWGSGKSSVLTMLDERLAQGRESAFLRVHFNPWVHRGESNMLVPLLHALRDTLLDDPKRRFGEAALKFASVLGTLAADALLSTVTAGRLTLDRIDQAKARYVEERGAVESELRGLRETMRREIGAINEQGVRVVIFVDDIDRCEPNDIVGLLESIKLFLDVPGVFVIMAISKDLVDRGVALKYHGFGFEPDRLLDIGDEYLEKMIQLPLYLLPLGGGHVRSLLTGLAPHHLNTHGELLEAILVPNPRKIKRVLNFLSVTQAIVAGTPGLERLSTDLILRLAVLRVQNPRLFGHVLVEPRVLIAMERLYQARLALSPASLDHAFGEAGQAMFQAIVPHYRSQPQLDSLFGTSKFEEAEGQLVTYLTMFGGPIG